ncbi:MAG: phosphatase PAP2 family protein [Nitrospirota bacterium]|nr:phosphatase PAP2 family protein [Nitrospirota bacterium]
MRVCWGNTPIRLLCTSLVSLALGAGTVWEQAALAAGEQITVVQEESLGAGAKAVVEDIGALLTAPMRMTGEDWLKVGAGGAVVGGLVAADHSIQDWVDRNNKSVTGKKVANNLNTFGNPFTLVGVNVGVIGIGLANQSYGGGSWIKEAGLVSLEAEVFAVAAAETISNIAGRARPNRGLGATHFSPFSGNVSFGSSHSAASFAVAAVFAERFDPAIGWLSYGLAGAVAASRVYTDNHFSADVVLGGLIGYAMGKFINRQHSADPDDWQIRPMTMEGVGGGLTIGKRF